MENLFKRKKIRGEGQTRKKLSFLKEKIRTGFGETEDKDLFSEMFGLYWVQSSSKL